MRVIISGGGTGGHIYPAIAIANALRARHPGMEILFVGAEGKMEMQKVPQAGYPIKGLPIRGLQRGFSAANLWLPWRFAKSLLQARRILQDFGPHVAVGVGGYASGPLLYMARLSGVPTLIQEQNSYAGLTNRWLARKAQRICVAYEGMEKFFPASKLVLTGNPVRSDIALSEQKKAEAQHFFKLDAALPTLLVIGGSLGAGTLNRCFRLAIDRLKQAPVQVLWQTGRHGHAEAAKAVSDAGTANLHVLEFINRMDLAYAAADVVVSRAGALSISELCVVGRPAILVPSPNVAEDHQTQNALALVRRDAAVLVKDADAPDTLVGMALELLGDEARKQTLARNIRLLARPDAADRIAAEVLGLMR